MNILCHIYNSKNEVSERINFTLMSRVRTLFAGAGLSKYLWKEAICCAAYQLNRSPTSATKGQIPAKLF